jgi:hypothetical protein
MNLTGWHQTIIIVKPRTLRLATAIVMGIVRWIWGSIVKYDNNNFKIKARNP